VSGRSNPKRNVPRDPQIPMGGGIPGQRSRSDFAGSSSRRLARRTRLHGGTEATRIDLDGGGTMPVSGLAPRPPPLLVLYEDLVNGLTPAPVYGQYPRGFIAKLLPWLRCERSRILHVCSGSLPKGEGIRVDIRPEAQPDFIADGRKLPFADGEHDAVMLDPPYSEGYAKSLYGVKYPRPSHLLREAARVVRPGGRIAIVHYITPKPVKGTRFVKAFGLSTGFDMPMRAVTIFERDQQELSL
jgi:SAM-dependent methyltransferase